MVVIDKEFQALIPPLSIEEKQQLEANKLGFEWFSDGCCCSIYPTPMSPSFWIFSSRTLSDRCETYTTRPTAFSRRPKWWKPCGQVQAFLSECYYSYPPSVSERMPLQQDLYIIQATCGGPIKIGVAIDVNSRIKQLQTGNPYELQIVAVYKNAGQFESAIHKMFQLYRLEGEWFSGSILDLVVEAIEKEGWQLA